MSPRKSLTGSGESRRMIFRVDNEVEDILSQVTNKSLFIRKSIIHYWKIYGFENVSTENSRKDELTNLDQPDSVHHPKSVKNTEEKTKITTNRVWSPPWKRG